MRTRLVIVVLGATLLGAGLTTIGGAVTRTNSEEINQTEGGFVDTRCPRGTRVVLGGMRVQFDLGLFRYAYIEDLFRPSKRVLRVGVYAAGTPATTTAIATCQRQPRSRKVAEQRVLGDEQEASVTARCSDGKRVVFGGFRGDLTGSNQYVSPVAARARGGGRSWKVSGTNTNPSDPGTLTSLAYCGNVGRVTERSAAETLGPPPDRATATARCRRSERLAFGGFDVNVPAGQDYVIPIGLERRGRRWSVTAVNDFAPAGNDVKAYAYCVER